MTSDTPRLARAQAPSKIGLGALAAARAYAMEHYARSLFVLVFLLPTLVALAYYAFIASDRYVSEARFIVRSVNSPATGSTSAFLQDFGIVRANDDAFAIHDYILSRDAMKAIMRRIDLRQVWSRDEEDFWTRYGTFQLSDTDEALFNYYKSRVQVEKDMEAGITSIKVSAHRAEDAQAIVRLLLALSEARVNEMNLRARRDSLRAAEQTTSLAARQLAQATVALTRYRDASQLVDPEQSADASIERKSDLDQELARLQVDLQTMRARAPGNPAIPALRQRIAALAGQVAVQRGELTGATGSLASKLGDYERLLVEQELAEKTYEAAQEQLNSAHEQVQRQQVYLETVAQPNLPDEAAEPRRLRYVFTVALLSFWSFLILYLLVSGSREHLNVS